MSNARAAAGVLSSRRPPGVKVSADSGVIAGATTSGVVSVSSLRKSGDLLLVFAAMSNTADTISTPAGWTLQAGPVDSTTASNVRGYVFSKISNGTEGASLTVTKVGTSASWRLMLVMLNATAGVDTVASAVASANGTSATIPTVTPTTGYGAVVAAVLARTGVSNVTPPSGFTELRDTNGTPSIEICIQEPVPASATGAATAMLNASAAWATFAVPCKHI